MCRFVAVLSMKDIDLEPHLDFLKYQAKNGKRAPHKDGFGYWILSENGEHYYRSTIPAWEHAGSLPKGSVAFFHARKRGLHGAPVSILNVHPFIKNGAVFMHNGLLKIDRHPMALGDTDTESFFLKILEEGIDNTLKSLEKKSYTSLNFVMWDRARLIIFRAAKRLKNYFTIFIKKEESRIIISTEGDESWREIKNGEMIIIQRDLSFETRCIFQDMCH